MSNPVDRFISDILQQIRQSIDGITRRVSELPESLRQGVSREIGRVNEGIQQWIDEVRRQLESVLNSAHSITRDVINRVGQSIENVVNSTSTAVNNTINLVKTGFDKAVASATDSVKAAIDVTKNAVGSAVDSARLAVERAIQTSTTQISNAISYAQDAVKNTANLVKAGIDTTVALARDTVRDTIVNTVTLVTRAIDGTQNAVITAVNATKNAVEIIARGVEASIKTVVDFARNGIATAISSAVDIARSIGNALIDAVKNNTAFLVERATTLFLNVKSQIDSVVQNIADSIGSARRAIEERIRELVAFLLQKVSELLQFADEYYRRIQEFSKKLWDDFYQNLQRGSAVASGEIRSALSVLLSGNYNDIDGAIEAINSVIGLEEFSKFLLYALAATFIFGNALPAIAAPYLQNVTNKINATVLPATIGVEIIAEAVAKQAIDIQTGVQWCSRLGVSGAMLEATILAGTGYLTASEAVSAYTSGLIGDNELATYLMRDRRSPEIMRTLVELTRKRLDATSVFDAVSAGVWTEAQADDELIKSGYTSDRIAALRSSYYNTLSLEDIRNLYLRNEITAQERDYLLRRNRFDDRSIELSYRLDSRIPPLADLVRFGIKDVYNDEFAARYDLDEELPQEFIEDAKKQGLSEKYAKYYWRASWDLPSPTMGYEMYHRGIITRDELAFLLKISDYPRFWRDKMIEMSYNPLTRVDVRRMYQLGVMTREDVKRAYLDLGYSPEHAELLTRFTETLTQTGENDTDDVRRLTKNEILRALRLGVITEENARETLREAGYADRDIDTLVKLALIGKAPERNEPVVNDHFQRTRRLIAKLYADDYITRNQAIDMLVDIGYTRENAAIEIALIEREDDYDDDEQIIRLLRKMYDNRVLSDDEYRRLLRTVIVVPEEQIDAIIKKDDFIRELRAELPSMADMNKWVRKGYVTADEYAEYLRARGIAEKYIVYYLADMFPEG